MANYIVDKYDGSKSFTVVEKNTNTTDTSLVLIGDSLVGWGEYVGENYLWLMENFAGSTPPNKAVAGQLWFHKNGASSGIYIYTGDDIGDGGDSTQLNDWALISSTDASVNRAALGVYSKSESDAAFLRWDNMGQGSSIDADMVDGLQSNQLLRTDVDGELLGNVTFKSLSHSVVSSQKAPIINLSGAPNYGLFYHEGTPDHMYISTDGNVSTHTLDISELGIVHNGNTMWHAGNGGSGSGMDSDLLDGKDGSYYLNWPNTTNKPSPRLTLSGDCSGTATFNSMGDAILSVTVGNDTHTHDGRYYTESEANGRFLLVGGTAANSTMLNGQSASNYLRSNVNDTMYGVLETRYGIHGGYGNNQSTGGNWGANIWGMGASYDGSGWGTSYSPGSYGLSWLRGSHPNVHSAISEGLHVYRNGVMYGGIGMGGVFTSAQMRAVGNITAFYSDERLKDIIEELDPKEALESVISWSKVRYTANDLAVELSNGVYDKSKVEIGLLSGEVRKTYPEVTPLAVFDDEYGQSKSGKEYRTMQYERLITVQAAAIEQLNTLRISDNAKIQTLEERLAKLEEIIYGNTN